MIVDVLATVQVDTNVFHFIHHRDESSINSDGEPIYTFFLLTLEQLEGTHFSDDHSISDN